MRKFVNRRIADATGPTCEHELASENLITDGHIAAFGLTLAARQHGPSESKEHHLAEDVRLMLFGGDRDGCAQRCEAINHQSSGV